MRKKKIFKTLATKNFEKNFKSYFNIKSKKQTIFTL